MKIKKIPGFTLNEMLIAVGIIGVLASLAVPKLYPLIAKAKAKEAELQLKYIATLQEQYSYMNSSFTNSLDALDFVVPLTVKNGGTSNYRYEIIEASSTTFKARAEAVIDFDGDGTLNVWEISEQGKPTEVIKD